ncbi:MAG: nucleoside hydrolase [Anaerolineales bacterium]|nr:nucleoside hydrolase [Anaerolineales bacterium]
MKRLVIDTDPGVDDAHAILMALAHPEAQVEAITTVAGNASLNRTTANALTILDVAEKDVPVYRGCGRAILAEGTDASHVHGDDGLGNINAPPSHRETEDEHAVQALIRLANEAPGELTLVTLGPLTNLAMAVRLDPSITGKYKQLVVMGGAVRSTGNTERFSTEFNLSIDPEAGAIVFNSWNNFKLVSWEATLAYPFDSALVAGLGKHNTPRSAFFLRISQNTLRFNRENFGKDALFTADSLAMAVALEPDIVTASERRFVQVETQGDQVRGQTSVDWSGISRREPNAEIVLELKQERVWELLEASVK